MIDWTKTLTTLAAVLLTLVVPAAAADDDALDGRWAGYSVGTKAVYQLEFDGSGGGKGARTGWLANEPHVFAYEISSLDFDGRSVKLTLSPLEEQASKLRLSGKLDEGVLKLKIKRAGGLEALRLELLRLDHFDEARERIDARLADVR